MAFFDLAALLAKLNGIKFPAVQVPSADPNTLDDYAELAFTPVLKFGGASVGITGAQSGTYTKVGRLVFFHITIVLTSKGSSTGTATIDGLPFPVNANVYGGAHNPYYDALASISGAVNCLAHKGTTSLDLNQGSSTTNTALTNANFTNTTTLILSGFFAV